MNQPTPAQSAAEAILEKYSVMEHYQNGAGMSERRAGRMEISKIIGTHMQEPREPLYMDQIMKPHPAGQSEEPWWVKFPWDESSQSCVRCSRSMKLNAGCEWDDDEPHFNLCDTCKDVVLRESLERFSSFATSQQQAREELKKEAKSYPDEIEECETQANKFKAEGDMYGWNYHTGRRAGIIFADIFMHKEINALKDAVKTLRGALENLTNEADLCSTVGDPPFEACIAPAMEALESTKEFA